MGVRPFAQLEPYYEAGDDGRVYREVDTGAERRHRHGPNAWMIATGWLLSVAATRSESRLPHHLWRAWLLSTEGGDIDDILRARTLHPVRGLLVAFLVMLFTLALSGGHHRRTGIQRRWAGGRPTWCARAGRARHHPQFPTYRRDRRSGRQVALHDRQSL